MDLLKWCLVVWMSLSSIGLLKAQSDVYDSLKVAVTSMPADTNKVNTLTQLGLLARKFDATAAEAYANEALEISGRLNYDKGTGKAYSILGLLMYYQGRFDEALEFQELALEADLRTNDPKNISGTYNDIANLYADKGDLKQAIEYYTKALYYAEELNDSMLRARSLANIGSIYQELKDYDNALNNYLEAIAITNQLDNASVPQTRMIVFANMSLIYKNKGELEKALELGYQSLEIRKRMNYTRGIASMLSALGELYAMKGDLAKGEQMILEGIEIASTVNDIYTISTGYGTLGELAMKQNKPDKAFEYYSKALEIAKEIGSLQLLRDSYEALSEVAEAKGDMKSALSNYKQYEIMKDSLLNDEAKQTIAELRTKYETEQAEREVQTQKMQLDQQIYRNKVQMIIFLLSITLVVLLAGLLYIRYKLRQEAILERTIADQQKLRFRAVIETQEQERKRIAQDLHDGLGQLLSTARLNVAGLEDALTTDDDENDKLWNNAINLIDESVTEVRNISHNMMPSALIRLGLISALREQVKKINQAGSVEVELEVEGINGRLPEATEISLYRITQETLNNTLKHAEAKHINISLSRMGERIVLSITDDGKGMDVKNIELSTGIGWKNIYSRVELMNGEIDINSTAGRGTKLLVSVPAA